MDYPSFESAEAYAAKFRDPAYWKPYVRAVLERHGFPQPSRGEVPPLATNPVFVVDERVVVKLYTPFFNGEAQLGLERLTLNRLGSAGVLVPRVLAHGSLFPGHPAWAWPYVVLEKLEGKPLADMWDGLDASARRDVAVRIGEFLASQHAVDPGVRLRKAFEETVGSWDAWLSGQQTSVAARLAEWEALPTPLLGSVPDYLAAHPPTPARLCLLQGDLDGTHILGEIERGRWELDGVIDYGDAKLGDPLYDFVTIHLALFEGDKDLLRVCLDAYGSPLADRLPHEAMALSLLHEWDVLKIAMEHAQDPDLETAAERLWAL